MKFNNSLLITMLLGLFCMSTVQAAGNVMAPVAGVYSQQHNPWRMQQRGYVESNNNNVQAQQFNAAPLNLIPLRQYEYRRYVQQLSPYYEMHGGLPWWTGSGAIPNGYWPSTNSFW